MWLLSVIGGKETVFWLTGRLLLQTPFPLSLGLSPAVTSILHPSIFKAPVPYSSTLLATFFSDSGLRASIIGSHAGFSPVPYPDHFLASSDIGFPMGGLP